VAWSSLVASTDARAAKAVGQATTSNMAMAKHPDLV
jgi:hypothetical protein